MNRSTRKQLPLQNSTARKFPCLLRFWICLRRLSENGLQLHRTTRGTYLQTFYRSLFRNVLSPAGECMAAVRDQSSGGEQALLPHRAESPPCFWIYAGGLPGRVSGG